MNDPLTGSTTGGEPVADDMLPLVYDELRRLAQRFFARERSGHTLQPTALVHEAFLQLSASGELHLESRAHFLALAARAMRRILVDSARRRGAAKRGGGLERVTLSGALAEGGPDEVDVLALEDALLALGADHPRHAEVVELRFFGGLDVKEVAQVLGVSASTVMADWRFSRAWLGQALGHDP
jgi:RNA polymerase sigma factor (TIGR02999 family)